MSFISKSLVTMVFASVVLVACDDYVPRDCDEASCDSGQNSEMTEPSSASDAAARTTKEDSAASPGSTLGDASTPEVSRDAMMDLDALSPVLETDARLTEVATLDASNDGRGAGDASAEQPDGGVAASDASSDASDSTVTDAATAIATVCTGAGSRADCICEGGTTKCGLECVDLNNAHANCGGCGYKCAANQFCDLGTCDVLCKLPLVFCLEQCVDFMTDEHSCGSCGFECASSKQCVNGSCVG